MTPDQIKALAKQAGVQPYEHSQSHRESISFTPVQLAEFVRLVRESAFAEAAAQCLQLADCEENTKGYRNGAAWCAERIKGMK